jgi:hypothetical protein
MCYHLWEGAKKEAVGTNKDLMMHRLTRVLFVLLCIFLFPRSGKLAASLAPSSLQQAALHGVPLLITLVTMMLLSRSFSLRDMGFNLNHGLWSLKIFGISAPIIIAAAYGWVFFSGYTYHTDTSSAVARLLLQPVGQELLFRALVIGVLHPVFYQMRPFLGKGISSAGLISALLFALSAVVITIQPFTVTLPNPLLQILMLGLGVWYALIFEYTHSLLAPILIHTLFLASRMGFSYLLG